MGFPAATLNKRNKKNTHTIQFFARSWFERILVDTTTKPHHSFTDILFNRYFSLPFTRALLHIA
jgi:hypothetical protein